MSKVVNIWYSVNNRQIARLREEIANSVGIHKLVSEDDDYLMDLALAEIIENLISVGKSVAMLGKKCTDATYHDLESIFDDPSAVDPKWYGWQYRLKKMDRKVKKMEKFVAATEQLHSELEVLADLEQSFKRMRAGANLGRLKLLEFQQKVLWQRQEVKSLQDMSPWVRTYDYIVRLLLRSLFTIIERIKYAFGSDQIGNVDGSDCLDQNHADYLSRCNSMSGLAQTSGYCSENNDSAGRVQRTSSNLALRADKNILKNRRCYERTLSPILCAKHQMKGRRFASVGLTGCMTGGSVSPVVETYTHSCGSSFRSYGGSDKDAEEREDTCTIPTITSTLFNFRRRLMNAPPSTLGYAALPLHYANVILLIEKLASSPHLFGLDARDDLYDMLPSSIRSYLRAKLKTFSASSDHNAAEWSSAIAKILEWLSPLARNMIRWQCERNFERQRVVCGSNILLVQTLYFANQADTEAAIVQLLMGLSYLFRFDKEKTFRESSCSRAYDGYFVPRCNMYYDMIDHLQ